MWTGQRLKKYREKAEISRFKPFEHEIRWRGYKMVAVVDLMPILGIGLVLLPWALVVGVMGNMFLAIGMLALYLVITAIRNVVEPKLVGRKIGLHPLATLISMFVGLQLFGIIGMFLFPLSLSLLVQFKRDGIGFPEI